MNDLLVTVLLLFCYLVMSYIVAKLIHKFEIWKAKKDGYVDADNLDPTVAILLGLCWPLTIPSMVCAGFLWVFVCVFRALFFSN